MNPLVSLFAPWTSHRFTCQKTSPFLVFFLVSPSLIDAYSLTNLSKETGKAAAKPSFIWDIFFQGASGIAALSAKESGRDQFAGRERKVQCIKRRQGERANKFSKTGYWMIKTLFLEFLSLQVSEFVDENKGCRRGRDRWEGIRWGSENNTEISIYWRECTGQWLLMQVVLRQMGSSKPKVWYSMPILVFCPTCSFLRNFAPLSPLLQILRHPFSLCSPHRSVCKIHLFTSSVLHCAAMDFWSCHLDAASFSLFSVFHYNPFPHFELRAQNEVCPLADLLSCSSARDLFSPTTSWPKFQGRIIQGRESRCIAPKDSEPGKWCRERHVVVGI